MGDNIISLGIDPNDIRSLKDAAKSIDEIGAKLKLTAPQLKALQKGLEGAIAAMAKLKTSDPFTKLVKDTEKAISAFEKLDKSSLKLQSSITKALNNRGFVQQARDAKSLLVMEQKLNAELEKQARLTSILAVEQGRGSAANLQAASNLKIMRAQTIELQKQAGTYKKFQVDFANMQKWASKSAVEVGKLSNETNRLSASTKKAQIAMAGMARSVGVATLSYTALLPLMVGMAAGSSIKRVYDLGAAFEYTTTYVDALGDSLSSLSAGDIQLQLLDIEGLRKGPQELAAGMKEFAKAGVGAADSLRQIGEMSKFATVAEIGLAEANKLVIGQSKAFGIEFTEAANMISAAALSSATDIQELGTALSYTTELATVTGTTFDEVATAMAVMANAGIRGSKAGTAIRTSLLKMATPSEKLRKEFDALGISWTAFSDDGKIKSMRAMFTELERVTKALPDTQRVAILKDLFGLRALKGGANLLRAQGEEWDSLNQKIREAGESGEFLSGTYDKLADTTTAKWERLGVEIEKSLIKAFDSESVKAGLDALIDAVSSGVLTDGLSIVVDLLGSIADTMALILPIAAKFKSAMDFTSLLGGDLTKITEKFRDLGKSIEENPDIKEGWITWFIRKDLEILEAAEERLKSFKSTAKGILIEATFGGAPEPPKYIPSETQRLEAELIIALHATTSGPAGSLSEQAVKIVNIESDRARMAVAEALQKQNAQMETLSSESELKIALQTSVFKTSELTEQKDEALDIIRKYYVERASMIQSAKAKLGEYDQETDMFMGLDKANKRYKEQVKLIQDAKAALGEYGQETDMFMGKLAADTRAEKYFDDIVKLQSLRAKLGAFDQETDMFMGKPQADAAAAEVLTQRANELTSAYIEIATAVELANYETATAGLNDLQKSFADVTRQAQEYRDSGVDEATIKEFVTSQRGKIQTLHDEEMALKDAEQALESWQKQHEEATKEVLKYTKQMENFNDVIRDMKKAEAQAGMGAEVKLFDDIDRQIAEGLRLGTIHEDVAEGTREALIRTAVAQGDLTKAREDDIQKAVEQARANENLLDGFNAGLLDAITNTKTLGELGYELAGQFSQGVEGTFSAIFNGEFDTIGDLWKDTLDSMLNSVKDWAAKAASEFVIEQSVDFLFGEGSAAKMGLGSGPSGTSGDPVHVVMAGMGGAGVSGDTAGLLGDAYDAISSWFGGDTTLSNMFDTEYGNAWDNAATSMSDSFDSSLDGAWWNEDSSKIVDSMFDTGASAWETAASDFWSGADTGISLDAFDIDLSGFNTTMGSVDDTLKSTQSFIDNYDFNKEYTFAEKAQGYFETAKPYVGAAAGAYGIYSGIQEGGVGGTLQAAGGVATLATNEAITELIPALSELSGTFSALGAGVGAAGGLYGMYQGVESGDYVQAAGGAVQAYQGATTLFPEIGTAISEGFANVGSYFAAEAATEAGTIIVAETAATGAGSATGAGMSAMSGIGGASMIGMAVAMAMDIYGSETEDKFKYESSYGGFEVAEKGQDRGSALVRSMDTIMEDLAISVEAGASAIQYVPEDVSQRANQHLEVLWTEFGEGMAGMALAIDPTIGSFDSYIQATTGFSLSTQELAWAMETATAASFGNIESVVALEYKMQTLGQSTIEASVSAAGMISAMGEASSSMEASGQMYYTTLAQMANGTSDFDGTVRELQATLGVTDSTVHDLSGTLEGATGKLDVYGNVITDLGGDASEAASYMETFGGSIRGMSDEAVAAMNALNGISISVPTGYSERGATNADGATYSYHARGGIMEKPTVFHIGGEAGNEAIMPLHAGPNTLEIMHEDIKAAANRPVQITITGDEKGFKRFIRVEADDLVTTKLQSGQGTQRTTF